MASTEFNEEGIFQLGPGGQTPPKYPPYPSQAGFAPYTYGGNPPRQSVTSYSYYGPGMQNSNHYPPPGAGMSPSGSAASHPSVVVVSQPDPAHLVPIRENYSVHIVSACLVFLFCGFLFGGIAFILAAMANEKASDGDIQEARQLGQVSAGLSVTGLITGLIFWSVIIWAMATCC